MCTWSPCAQNTRAWSPCRYIDADKVTPEAAAQLAEAAVAVKPYDGMLGDVRSMAGAGVKIWMDPTKVRHLGMALCVG
jgi:hypothetical protein